MSLTAGRPREGKGNRGNASLSIIAGGSVDLGPCPAKLGGVKPLASTVASWELLRNTPHLGDMLANGLDEVVVVRWAELIDVRERALRVYNRHPFVEGTAGKPITNPAWAIARDCSKELTAIEDRLGGSPLSRMRLGVVVAEAATGLGRLSALMTSDTETSETDLRAVSDV